MVLRRVVVSGPITALAAVWPRRNGSNVRRLRELRGPPASRDRGTRISASVLGVAVAINKKNTYI